MDEYEALVDRVLERGASAAVIGATYEAAKMQDKATQSQFGPVDAVCHCGSCADAYRAALRQYIQLRESGHCAYWMTQIAVAMRYFASMEMLHHAGAKYEELTQGVKKSEPNGTLSEERADELDLLIQLSMREQDSIATVMTQFCAQPEGLEGYVVGGKIIEELFTVLDAIKQRKGN